MGGLQRLQVFSLIKHYSSMFHTDLRMHLKHGEEGGTNEENLLL